MDVTVLSKNPACSLRACTALFSSLLAANLHMVLPKTLAICFATGFLKVWFNLDLASKIMQQML